MASDADAASPETALAAFELTQAQLFLFLLQRRRPLITWALLLAIGICFGLEQLWGGGSTATLVRMGALVPSRIREGEWWRLLSPTFLHSGVPHILMNGVVLWMLGPFIERLFGSARFLILYTLCGLLGSVFGLLFAGLSKFSLSVGASGALFGLLGASAVLGLWPRGQIPPLIVKDLRKNALINLGLNVMASLRPNVDYLAHLGGAVAGILLVGVALLRPTISLQREQPSRVGEGIAHGMAVMCGIALLGSIGMAFTKGQPWQLMQPLKMERQQIRGAGVSLETPTLLGRAANFSREDGAIEVGFGNGLDAPMSLAVLITPFDKAQVQELNDPAVLRQVFDQAVVTARSYAPSQGALPVGTPEEIEVDGVPALSMKYRFGTSGAILHRLFQIRPRFTVALEMIAPADLRPNLRLDLVQVLSSLREEGKS